jgi:hypothetical protein
VLKAVPQMISSSAGMGRKVRSFRPSLDRKHKWKALCRRHYLAHHPDVDPGSLPYIAGRAVLFEEPVGSTEPPSYGQRGPLEKALNCPLRRGGQHLAEGITRQFRRQKRLRLIADGRRTQPCDAR